MNKLLSVFAISGTLVSNQPNDLLKEHHHISPPQKQEQKFDNPQPFPQSKDSASPNNWVETLWYTDKNNFVSVYYNYYDVPECVALTKEFRKEIKEQFARVGLIETPMKFLPESTHENINYPEVYVTLACGSELKNGRIERKDGDIFLSIGGMKGAVMWKNYKIENVKNIPDMVRWWTRLILGGTEI